MNLTLVAIYIAAASLFVDAVGTIFDIAWSIYLEHKHNKKD